MPYCTQPWTVGGVTVTVETAVPKGPPVKSDVEPLMPVGEGICAIKYPETSRKMPAKAARKKLFGENCRFFNIVTTFKGEVGKSREKNAKIRKNSLDCQGI